MQYYVNTRLLRQVQGQDVDFEYLSDHPDLTPEVIKAFPDAKWDWESITVHDNMCLQWLLDMPDAPWDWAVITNCDNWTFDWVRKLPRSPWEWQYMHHEDTFSLDWVAEFPYAPWNMEEISKLASIERLRQYDIMWNWSIVTAVSPIRPSEMVDNIDLPWDFTSFGFDHIDDDDILFLRVFRDQFDDECWMDFTESADWDTVRKCYDLPWAWNLIEFEEDEFKPEDIMILRIHRDEVNWNKMSMMVPYSIIKANLDLPWVAGWVSMNESLRWEDLGAEFNWDRSFVPCEPVESIVRRWSAANRIKWAFKRAISDPNYFLCRRRLLREHSELFHL
jgi:hypothetical protein